MPQRPRSQQLEAQSRQVFRARLPPEWAMRNQHEEDVGIDAEVEVFNKDANSEEINSSGVLFKVQLRATDEEDLQEALGVRVTSRQLAYFDRLTLPVLLARYHASTDTLYARWIHRFDIRGEQRERQTITLRLTEADIVSEASAQAWLEDMIVVLDPKRFEISPAPWASEFALTFRNVSSRPVYDVNYDITASPDTTLQLDRLRLFPQFEVNPLTNWMPMLVNGVYTESGKPFQLGKFQRMDPGREYAFVVRYEPAENERPDGPRRVDLRITVLSAEPSPIVSQ